MCDKFGIDDKTRFLVLHLDAHLDAIEISKIINRSVRIVRCWETRTKKGEDIRNLKKKDKSEKVITEEIENKIIQMVKDNPEGASVKKLAGQIGIPMNAVQRVLTSKGYKYVGFDKTVIYLEEEKQVRVEFCNRMLADEGKLIYRSFFSDEMGIELNYTHKARAWQIPSEKIRKTSVPILDNIKLDCWGAISVQGATTLDVYRKGMRGELYREIIERHKPEMEKLYPDGDFYFIQDNHPVHRMNEDWLVKKQNLKLIKWPRRSPDLNVIENLWAALKEKVISEVPNDEQEMRASLLNNWEKLTAPDKLKPMFEALHRRYMDCVTKEGQKLPTIYID